MNFQRFLSMWAFRVLKPIFRQRISFRGYLSFSFFFVICRGFGDFFRFDFVGNSSFLNYLICISGSGDDFDFDFLIDDLSGSNRIGLRGLQFIIRHIYISF